MKKINLFFLTAAFFLVGSALAADPPRDGAGKSGGGRDGAVRDGGVDGRDGNWNRAGRDGGWSPDNGLDGHHHLSRAPGDFSSTRSIQRWGQMGIHNVPRPIPHEPRMPALGHGQTSPSLPSRGPEGHSFHSALVSPHDMNSAVVRDHMRAIAKDRAFTDQVTRWKAGEREPGHTYWHNYNGINYCHFYDRRGNHWYGWWRGGSFFWTQFYWGYWWWFDPLSYRWCYWSDGWWWWQDPYNVVYVYDDGQYVTPDSLRNFQQGISEYRSGDGSRMVKLMGGDAFLYDISGAGAFRPFYLTSGVKEVRFSNTKNGEPLQILLVLNDNSFELFDGQGNPLTGGEEKGASQ